MLISGNNIPKVNIVFAYRENYKIIVDDFIDSMETEGIDHNFISLWDKPLYGKVDNEFMGIIPNPDMIEMFDDIEYFSFVYDAYSDFADYFKRSCKKRKLLYSQLMEETPTLSYVDSVNSFQDYSTELKEAFKNYATQFGDKIVDFPELLLTFRVFIEEWKGPISFTGWGQSTTTPYHISGLFVNVLDEDYSDDAMKFERFFINDVFKVYVESARRFGFLIDRNAPWRLIADVNSKAMQYYMHRFMDLEALEERYREVNDDEEFLTGFDALTEGYTDFSQGYIERKPRLSLNEIFNTFFIRSYSALDVPEDEFIERWLSEAWEEILNNRTGDECPYKIINNETIKNKTELYLKIRAREMRMKLSPMKSKKISQKSNVLRKGLVIDDNLRYVNAKLVSEKFGTVKY